VDAEGLFDVPAGPASTSGSGSLRDASHSASPLAVRMRPQTLDDLVGQRLLLAEGSPLRQLIEDDRPMSLLLWGPPGTGKTTIASILSRQTDRRFVEVSAVAAGVKEVRAVIDDARRELVRGGRETVLFVDEVHRFTKAQQHAPDVIAGTDYYRPTQRGAEADYAERVQRLRRILRDES